MTTKCFKCREYTKKFLKGMLWSKNQMSECIEVLVKALICLMRINTIRYKGERMPSKVNIEWRKNQTQVSTCIVFAVIHIITGNWRRRVEWLQLRLVMTFVSATCPPSTDEHFQCCGLMSSGTTSTKTFASSRMRTGWTRFPEPSWLMSWLRVCNLTVTIVRATAVWNVRALISRLHRRRLLLEMICRQSCEYEI